MNEKVIWDFLKNKGLNDYAVAGIMGNLFAESGLNPKNLQNNYEKKLGMTDDSYTTKVDNGSYKNFVKDSAGYGLAQWTYWSRKEALLKFAKSSKKSIGDLSMQLDFLWKELQGYAAMMTKIRNAKSVLEASNAILFDFERPANQDATVQAKRAKYGQVYYDKYAGKPAEPQKTPQQIAVDNAVADGIIASPDYWLSVLNGKTQVNPEYLLTVFQKYHEKLMNK